MASIFRLKTSYQWKSRLTYTPSGHSTLASQIGVPVFTPAIFIS